MSPRMTVGPSIGKTVRYQLAADEEKSPARLPAVREPRLDSRIRTTRSAGDLRAKARLGDVHSTSQGKLKKSALGRVTPARAEPPSTLTSRKEFETRLALTLEEEVGPLAHAKSAASARNAACQLFRNSGRPGQKFIADLRRMPEMIAFSREFADRLDRLPLLRPEALTAHYVPCTGFVVLQEFAGGIDATCMASHFAPSLEAVVDAIKTLKLPPAAVATVAALTQAIDSACAANRRSHTEAGDKFCGIDKQSQSEFITIATKAVMILGIVAPELRKWSDRQLAAPDQRKSAVSRLIGHVLMKIGTGNEIEANYFPPRSQAILEGKLRSLAAEPLAIMPTTSGLSAHASGSESVDSIL